MSIYLLQFSYEMPDQIFGYVPSEAASIPISNCLIF